MPCAVLVTRPNLEKRVELNLARQGFDYYSPRAEVLVAGRPKVVRLFPRYMFVWVLDAWRALMGTSGVSHLVQFGGEPGWVSDEVIRQIRDREDYRGLVVVGKRGWEPNQRIQVKSGPLEGYEGLYQSLRGRDRVLVLLSLMGGGALPVEVREADIAAL